MVGVAAPRGITLLEVLIAMFVLAVGLLSVAALIPAGKQQMVEAAKYDRSTAQARAALHELKVRGFLNWKSWRNYAGDTQYTHVYAWRDLDEEGPDATTPQPLVEYQGAAPAVPALGPAPFTQVNQPQVAPLGPLGRGNAVCIDPLLIGRYLGSELVSAFPLPLKNDPQQETSPTQAAIIPDEWPNAPRMTRLTVSRDGTLNSLAMSLPAAKRVFTWQDAVVFSQPTDSSKRPIWSVVTDKGTSASSQSALSRQTADDYSWFATVVPSDALSSTTNQTEVTASVAVVYKRDLNYIQRGEVPTAAPFSAPAPGERPAPPERIVFVDVMGSGIGGGEMRLRLAAETGTANDNPAQPEKSDLPAVKIGQWIMLTGWKRPDLSIPAADLGAAAYPPERTAVFRWYRVTNAGGLQYGANFFGDGVNQWYQNVTLSGPDWNPEQFLDTDNPQSRKSHIDPTTNGRTATAIIVQGVVAVYEQTIQLE